MRKSNGASVILAVTLALVFAAAGLHAQSETSDDARWKELDGAGSQSLAEGRSAEAEKSWKEALQLAERFGAEDGRLIISLNNLADLYQNQARYAEAEPYRKRALGLMEKRLGPEHPLVVEGINSLAKLYWLQGKYVEAEPVVKKLLSIVESVLGPEHPDAAQILNNLAELYKAEKKYADAEATHKRALAIRENALFGRSASGYGDDPGKIRCGAAENEPNRRRGKTGGGGKSDPAKAGAEASMMGDCPAIAKWRNLPELCRVTFMKS
jgi:tetratricopeptide (TPR) repeat protein